MLIFKYEKSESAAFIAHLDTLRAIIRTIRRAGIKVNYSQGYNPHMNLYMSPPIPLGTQSLSEYCTVDTDMPADEFKTLYNKYCIKGINCLNAVNVVKNPNIAANAAAALYEIKSKFLKENFENIIEKKELLVTTEKKGIKTEKNVINDILSWEKTEEGIDIVLKFGGNGNLRIDNFLHAVNAEQDSDVIKKELYCTKNAKIILTDEFVLEFRL